MRCGANCYFVEAVSRDARLHTSSLRWRHGYHLRLREGLHCVLKTEALEPRLDLKLGLRLSLVQQALD
jgi:hypothetical protein